MTCATLVRNGPNIFTVGYSSTRLLTQFGLSADVSVAKIKQKAKHLKFISLFFCFLDSDTKSYLLNPLFCSLYLICYAFGRLVFYLKSSDLSIHHTKWCHYLIYTSISKRNTVCHTRMNRIDRQFCHSESFTIISGNKLSCIL